MVRPLTSKRKLFNNNKDQFKENEPDQLNSTESESYSARTTLSSGLYSNHKSLNASKKGLAESSSCEGKKESGLGSIGIDWHRRCSFEDGGNVLTPGRTAMPMSERQQIALVMQLSSPSPTNKSDLNSLGSPQTPTPPHFGRGLAKRNERGETPLHVAAIKGDRDKVSQLIAQGANVNATDYAGWTALHEACNRGFLVIASLLIRGGAEVNAKGLDDDTPLHDACVNNHFQIVRLLLNSGARTDAINCRGKTPFDVCRSAGILSLLEEAKAGKLQDLGTPEKDFNKRRIQEVSLIERDFCATNNNESYHNNNNSPDDYSPHIHNKDSFGMSRKTPPSSKMEEKPTIPTSTSSSTPTSTAGGLSTNGNGVSSGANGRPVSPRVTLRLPHVPRTPDKSQQRSHDSKSTPEGEDVYEFRCSKEESKEGENEEKSDSGSKQQDSSPSDVKGDKRPRENDPDEDDELKKKRRKEEGKEGMKNTGRGTGGRPSSSEKGMKVGQRTTPANGSNNNKPSSTPTSTNVTSSTVTSLSNTVTSTSNSSTVSSSTNAEQRKSPPGSAVSSPRPPSGGSKASAEKSDSDNEEVKNESTAAGAPKVPPLKIVLAPCGLSEQETSSLNGKNGSNRQLPYVVNSSSSSAEEKDNPSADSGKESVVVKEELCTTVSSSCGNTSTITSIGTSSNTTAILNSSGNLGNSAVNVSNVSSSVITTTTLTTDKSSAARITRSQRGGGGGGGGSSSSNEDQVQVKPELKSDDPLSTDVVHPRKRKIKMKEPEAEQIPPSSVPEQPVTNCYEMFLKIRKQVERRRKLLFPVQPKPPQGFKDYLMNRCSYVLANSSNSQLSVPIIPPPTSLTHQALKDLFTEQEQERYKLRLQQLIEKEKLVLSVEQEILRVHGRAARALANQVLPFSVCTILKDEEVYNVISPEQEEKDRNARSRYNGRLFLSWLQDVDDKWEKIKEAMVLRHHNEAESLHAVQKMDWEWKLKELGLAEPNTKVQIDELHVPMVQVADFDLLPV